MYTVEVETPEMIVVVADRSFAEAFYRSATMIHRLAWCIKVIMLKGKSVEDDDDDDEGELRLELDVMAGVKVQMAVEFGLSFHGKTDAMYRSAIDVLSNKDWGNLDSKFNPQITRSQIKRIEDRVRDIELRGELNANWRESFFDHVCAMQCAPKATIYDFYNKKKECLHQLKRQPMLPGTAPHKHPIYNGILKDIMVDFKHIISKPETLFKVSSLHPLYLHLQTKFSNDEDDTSETDSIKSESECDDSVSRDTSEKLSKTRLCVLKKTHAFTRTTSSKRARVL